MGMVEDPRIICSYCGHEFWLEWVAHMQPSMDYPEYCPWCGEEIDYEECREEE